MAQIIDATALRVLDAVKSEITRRVAALDYDHDDDSLAEYRAARHAAIRSLATWVVNDRTVVVTISDADYQYKTAEVLDQAVQYMDLGPDCRIEDAPRGARIVW